MCKRIVCVLTLLLAAIVPSAAQFKQRDVSGVVTDARGNPLPQVAVQLENQANLSVRSYITGRDGRFFFAGLNDDTDFTLKAKYRRFWSKPKTLSKFNSEPHPEVNLVIPID